MVRKALVKFRLGQMMVRWSIKIKGISQKFSDKSLTLVHLKIKVYKKSTLFLYFTDI